MGGTSTIPSSSSPVREGGEYCSKQTTEPAEQDTEPSHRLVRGFCHKEQLQQKPAGVDQSRASTSLYKQRCPGKRGHSPPDHLVHLGPPRHQSPHAPVVHLSASHRTHRWTFPHPVATSRIPGACFYCDVLPRILANVLFVK